MGGWCPTVMLFRTWDRMSSETKVLLPWFSKRVQRVGEECLKQILIGGGIWNPVHTETQENSDIGSTRVPYGTPNRRESSSDLFESFAKDGEDIIAGGETWFQHLDSENQRPSRGTPPRGPPQRARGKPQASAGQHDPPSRGLRFRWFAAEAIPEEHVHGRPWSSRGPPDAQVPPPAMKSGPAFFFSFFSLLFFFF